MFRVVPVYLLLSADEAVPSVFEPFQERPRQIRVARGVRVSAVLVDGIPEGALVEVPEALLDEPNLVTVRPSHGFLGIPEVLVLGVLVLGVLLLVELVPEVLGVLFLEVLVLGVLVPEELVHEVNDPEVTVPEELVYVVLVPEVLHCEVIVPEERIPEVLVPIVPEEIPEVLVPIPGEDCVVDPVVLLHRLP